MPCIRFVHFPGGPACFEALARTCYDHVISITTPDLAALYCGSRMLGLAESIRATDAALQLCLLRCASELRRVTNVLVKAFQQLVTVTIVWSRRFYKRGRSGREPDRVIMPQ